MPARADGSAVDWTAGIRGAWDISEAGALCQMAVFLDAGAPGRLQMPVCALVYARIRCGTVAQKLCAGKDVQLARYSLPPWAVCPLQLAICKHPAGM